MKNLLAFAGSSNAAGPYKLAVFFLSSLFIFITSSSLYSCSSDANYSKALLCPYVVNGSLYAYPLMEDKLSDTDTISFEKKYWSFTKNGVSSSKKNGCLIAWNQNNQTLLHINSQKKVLSSVKLSAHMVFTGPNFVLAQSNSFDEKKGFEFTLYSLAYSGGNKKIKLKTSWSGFIDCFISDFFFTKDGICISGGNQADKKNNVFYITDKGIHKCFSTEKKSDFLRLVPTQEAVFAFASTRDKSPADAFLYKFTLDDYIEGNNSLAYIDLKKDSSLPEDFESFFGYGFAYKDSIVLPSSINKQINFVIVAAASGKIQGISPQAVGCTALLGSDDDSFYYIARDVLLENSWYGIASFDGKSSKKIKKFF